MQASDWQGELGQKCESELVVARALAPARLRSSRRLWGALRTPAQASLLATTSPSHICIAFQSDGGVVELLAALLLHQRLLDRRLVYFIGVLFTRFRQDAQAREQLHVLVGLRVGGGQQFVAVEDRVGAGE